MTIKLNKELAYRTIINKHNNPHTASITLLEEIINQHQLQLIPDPANKGEMILYSPLVDGWKVGYKYFEEKYNLKYAQARYAFRKLAKYNLIERRQAHTGYQPLLGKAGSEICIRLNLENIKKFLI